MVIEHIAFYGSLQSAHTTKVHQAIERNLTLLGACELPGYIYDMGRYPALKPGSGKVKAELYRINDQTVLELLDEYEANDNFDPQLPGFTRQAINLTSPNLVAWAYFYDGTVSPAELIPSGVWS